MAGVGQMMVGGLTKEGRQADDFYPTPAECTQALLEAEGWRISRYGKEGIWEPACGDGAISQVLFNNGLNVVSSDLRDRGYGDVKDFLKTEARPNGVRAIITNPPFNLAEAFVRHSRDLGVYYIAMLLKAQFWHASSRIPLWDVWQPHSICPLAWRPDFLGKGAPTMDVAWVVWNATSTAGETIYRRPLPRPRAAGQFNMFGKDAA